MIRNDVHWTFGVDYDQLTPLEQDKELLYIAQKVENLVQKGKWDQFFDLIDKEGDDFQVQFEEVLASSKERMILNDLEVYGSCHDQFCILNRLPEAPWGKEQKILDEISQLILVGENEKEQYGSETKVLYGYLQLQNRQIRAVTMMFRKKEDGYWITGPVG